MEVRLCKKPTPKQGWRRLITGAAFSFLLLPALLGCDEFKSLVDKEDDAEQDRRVAYYKKKREERDEREARQKWEEELKKRAETDRKAVATPEPAPEPNPEGPSSEEPPTEEPPAEEPPAEEPPTEEPPAEEPPAEEPPEEPEPEPEPLCSHGQNTNGCDCGGAGGTAGAGGMCLIPQPEPEPEPLCAHLQSPQGCNCGDTGGHIDYLNRCILPGTGPISCLDGEDTSNAGCICDAGGLEDDQGNCIRD
jgi:outer membrane biosynthesis protein TonB